MATVFSLFLMFLISLFNPYGAVSISIAISLSLLSPISYPLVLELGYWIFDCSLQVQFRAALPGTV